MRILVIDTSTERPIAGIVDGKQLLFSLVLPFGLQSSQFLLPELQKSLTAHSITLSDINLVAVGVGPGSYTGIRVGATVAKTFSFAHNIPLVGICSLDSFVPEKDGEFATLIDAKIGGVYLRKAQLKNGHISFLSDVLVLPLAEAVTLLAETPLLLTPNASSLQKKMAALSAAEWQETPPSILRLAALGQEKFLQGQYSSDAQLELLYMRKTQAEIERGK